MVKANWFMKFFYKIWHISTILLTRINIFTKAKVVRHKSNLYYVLKPLLIKHEKHPNFIKYIWSILIEQLPLAIFSTQKPKGTFYLFFTKLLKIIKLTSNSTPCKITFISW